jgi:hypothetical protein
LDFFNYFTNFGSNMVCKNDLWSLRPKIVEIKIFWCSKYRRIVVLTASKLTFIAIGKKQIQPEIANGFNNSQIN